MRKTIGPDKGDYQDSDATTITPDLIRKIKEGDIRSFEMLYLRLANSMKDFHAMLLGSVEDAEDVVQNVFAQLWENRESLDPDKNIKNFLYVVAKNISLKILRRKYPNLPIEQDDELPIYDNSLADDQLIEKETRLAINIAIGLMPKNRKEAFILYTKGMKYKEIAVKMNITEDNAYQCVSRARKELKKMLKILISFFLYLN